MSWVRQRPYQLFKSFQCQTECNDWFQNSNIHNGHVTSPIKYWLLRNFAEVLESWKVEWPLTREILFKCDHSGHHTKESEKARNWAGEVRPAKVAAKTGAAWGTFCSRQSLWSQLEISWIIFLIPKLLIPASCGKMYFMLTAAGKGLFSRPLERIPHCRDPIHPIHHSFTTSYQELHFISFHHHFAEFFSWFYEIGILIWASNWGEVDPTVRPGRGCKLLECKVLYLV